MNEIPVPVAVQVERDKVVRAMRQQLDTARHTITAQMQAVNDLASKVEMWRSMATDKGEEITQLKDDVVTAQADGRRWLTILKALPQCPHDFGNWEESSLKCRICDAIYEDVYNEQVHGHPRNE